LTLTGDGTQCGGAEYAQNKNIWNKKSCSLNSNLEQISHMNYYIKKFFSALKETVHSGLKIDQYFQVMISSMID